MDKDGCLSDSCQENKMSSGNSSPSESQGGGLKRLAMQLAKVIQILFTMLKRHNFFQLPLGIPFPHHTYLKLDLVHTATQTVLWRNCKNQIVVPNLWIIAQLLLNDVPFTGEI